MNFEVVVWNAEAVFWIVLSVVVPLALGGWYYLRGVKRDSQSDRNGGKVWLIIGTVSSLILVYAIVTGEKVVINLGTIRAEGWWPL